MILFAWIFGIRRGWEELHKGADIRVPRVFYYITVSVTPVCLIFLCSWWFYDAIDGGTLVPKPRVRHGVVNIQSHPGKFGSVFEARSRQWADAEGEISAVVERVRGDVQAWAEVNVSATGVLSFDKFDVQPSTVSSPEDRAILEASFRDWLEAQGFGYEVNTPEGGPSRSDVRATIAFEGLYTSPYIWLTRVLIVFFTVFFIVSIRVVWKSRPPTN